MKKYIVVLFLVMFITPYIAFASWWNPFSWKIFHKKEVASQVEAQKTSEKKINELQKQLDDLKKQQPASISTKTIKEEPKKSDQPVKVEKTKKESDQKVTTSIIKEQEVPSVVVETWAELEKRYSAEADQRGDTYMWIKNSLGEKKDYRKEGIQWIQKNSEAEAKLPYIDNKSSSLLVNENISGATKFEVISTQQTIFKESRSGGYNIVVKITAGKDDIFVPMTTTDTTTSITGFVYSLKGDAFRGDQISEVDCSTYRTINKIDYCSIKSGKSSTITTTVWLTPSQSGNYGILFESINYLVGTSLRAETFNVARETQKIYIRY